MSPLLLFPDFAIVALGYALRRFWLAPTAWVTIEKLVYFVLFPCLLFYAVANSPLRVDAVGAFALGSPAIILSAAVLGFLVKPLSNMSRVDFASGLQVAYRFNSYIGLALAGRLAGAQGVANMAILLALGVPLCNILAVGTMSRGKRLQVLLDIVKNPLVVATTLGLACKLLNFHVPTPLMLTLDRLGQGAVALGLMTVGAGLSFSGLKGHWGVSLWWLCIKLLVSPALALLYAHFTGLTILQTQILLVFASIPSASSAYILATRMGGNGPLVACLISMSTVGAALSIPLVFKLAAML